jgi:23S rRNA (pseudouridine1915-N3)-methyltransferase
VKLRVVVVGKDKNEPMCEAAREYVARIARYIPAELVEVKEEPAKASTPLARVRQVEAERLDKALGQGDYLIALDERGKEMTSLELARRIERFANEGRQSIAFVIGGPGGLDPEFVRRAKETWALSKMTLPHRVARLMLAEQLYRACTIMRGEPYHK